MINISILVDFHGTMIASIMVQIHRDNNYLIDEDLIRHSILNSIRRYRTKFGREYGNMIMSCDSGSSWRYSIFEQYKAKRKKSKDESEFDWVAIHEYMDKIKKELREYIPFPVLQVANAESDDIIGTLASSPYVKKCLIISEDKDFLQLLSEKVSIYKPIRDILIKLKD